MSLPLELQLPTDFFTRYWQREPIVLRQAYPNFDMGVDKETLFDLARDEAMESRLIRDHGTGVQPRWSVEFGPFEPQSLNDLGKTNWTLLVQGVDRRIDRIANLIRAVPRIPLWRIDDVMVSYAADGGSVGPHADNYDVFLVQGDGARRWQIGSHTAADAPLLADTELMILDGFDAAVSEVLHPGDVLYLPPRIAHWGIAEGPCLTYSIGFRAPSHADILLGASSFAAEPLDDVKRLADDVLDVGDGAFRAEIPAATIDAMHRVLSENLSRDTIARWFARELTEPRSEVIRESIPWSSDHVLRKRIDCRALFVRRDHAELRLFVDGESMVAPAGSETVLERLCAGDRILPQEVKQFAELFARLGEMGVVEAC